MIKVYIRSLLDEKGSLLGEFVPNEIENIVQLAKNYGVSFYDNEITEESYFDSQFVVSDEDIFFEIILKNK